MFLWTEKELNPKQSEIVTESSNILLVACPGSGKTRTLTYKIAYELDKLDNVRKFVIAITYTNKAAEEIIERIELLGVDTSQLWIGTIHSFCNEWILKPYFTLIDELRYGYRIIDAFESEQLLNDFGSKIEGENINAWTCNHYATIKGIEAVDQRESVSIVLKKYFSYLEANHAINYEQILWYSYSILIKHNIVSKTLANIFHYVLVDEYQDTKDIQYNILAIILKAGKGKVKNFIVGDPNQSIFGGLGGFPMSKEGLEKISGLNYELHHLENNYRSSERIVNYFDYYKTYDNRIISSGEDKAYPSLITLDNTTSVDDLVKKIVDILKYTIEEQNIRPEEICIVAPQWVHLASITRNLIVEMPDYSFNGPGMAPFSRDIENFWYKLSRIVLTEPSPNMYIRRMRWAKEIIEMLEENGININNITSKKILRLCNGIEVDEELGIPYLREVFKIFCLRLNIDLNSYAFLSNSYQSFFESSERRIERIVRTGNDSISSIESFRKVFKQREGVTISTIHGVKGLEFDTVIAFGVLEGYVPHQNDRDGDDSAKKLLYVIASRAKKNLHIISETGRVNYRRRALPMTKVVEKYEFEYSQIEREVID